MLKSFKCNLAKVRIVVLLLAFNLVTSLPCSAQNSLPEPTDNISFYLDRFQGSSIGYQVNGWAYIKGYSSTNSVIQLVLISDQNTYVINIESVTRPDVTERRGGGVFNYHRSGFSKYISFNGLETGKYQLAILITKNKNLKVLQYTDSFINYPYQSSHRLNPELDLLTIKIAAADFKQIQQKADEARRTNFLITSSEDYVPALIQHKGKEVNVKIRLKGDFIDHLEGDKWSYRIKVLNKETLFGMKRF